MEVEMGEFERLCRADERETCFVNIILETLQAMDTMSGGYAVYNCDVIDTVLRAMYPDEYASRVRHLRKEQEHES